MKVVCLVSGGLDSSSMMLLLKKYGYEIYPLHINYGHRAEEKEWNSCQCNRRIKFPQLWRLGIPQDRRFKIPHFHVSKSGGFCWTVRGGE